MSDWSNFQQNQWNEENRDIGDLKDDWDAEDPVEEPVDIPKPEPPKPKEKPMTKKEALKKAIELKEKEEKEAKDNPISDFDPYIEKQKRIELQEAADLENSKQLFEGLSVTETNELAKFVPKTAVDFEKYATLMADYAKKYDSSIHYVEFMKHFLRITLQTLSSKDSNEISKALTVIVNEKIKSEKTGAKAKKPAAKTQAKKSLNVDDEMKSYDDFDDDDFM
eukprot:gene10670-13069_t